VTNLRRGERQDLVVDAAMRAFGRTGYFGTTTGEIAREAGISQGYVIHLFGSKETLFLAALRRAGDAIVDQMRRIGLAEFDLSRFAPIYGRTALDRTVMAMLMQGFAACSLDAVAAYVRTLLAEMYAVLVDTTGASPEEARDYLARGLLVNVVLAMGLPEHADPDGWAKPLLEALSGSGAVRDD